jgi:antirestriction protein ArdC
VFWKFFGQSEEQQEGSDSTPDHRRCLARLYNVFNAAQVGGYTPAAREQLSPAARLENADRFFASLPGVVKHGGDQAYYSPAGDFIQMPPFAQFKSAAAYASTLGHEYAHWSGAASRLNRDLSGRFGSERYAMEELVAELSASFVCADLQIQSEPRADHAPYVASWLRILRNDRRAIFTAASKAQEVASYIQQLATLAQERAS